MNSSSRILVLAAALLGVCLAAQAVVMEGTVAVVNGSTILLSDYQKELDEALESWRRFMPAALADPGHVRKLRENILEELINREMLYQEGVKLKIKVRERDIDNGINEIKERFSKDEDGKELGEAEAEANFAKRLQIMGLSYAQFRERLGRQIMGRKVIDEEVRPKVKAPDEKESRDYFERVKAFLVSGSTEAPKELDDEAAQAFIEISQQVRGYTSERVRLSRILIRYSPNAPPREKKRAMAAAVEVRRKLQEGTSTFAEIAREDSEEPEYAARGGEIGFLIKGVAPPDFEKAAFSLPVGDISEPVETEVGYYILRVQEKRAAEDPSFDKFKEELAKALMNVNYLKELEIYIKALKAKAIIERHPPAQ